VTPATEAAEPATAAVESETAAVEPAQTEEPSQELEQVSAAVQPDEQEPGETAETVATEAAPAETVTEEAAPEETAAAPEETSAAPEVTAPEAEAPAAPVNLAEAQVAFSHWDVEVPFDTSRRRASTGNMFSITGVDANQDMSVIGDWVQRGATIFTLNGKPVRDDASFAAQVLENLQVDPDGYLRVAARYRPLGETRAQNGLLALPAFRTIGLENGYGFSVNGNGVGGWQTVVTEVPDGASGSLQTGDVLVSEAETGLAFEGPESLDAVLAELVSGEQPQARFAVSRNGADTGATMPLAQE
jgi:chemotaxis protein histidine kinase CheA